MLYEVYKDYKKNVNISLESVEKGLGMSLDNYLNLSRNDQLKLLFKEEVIIQSFPSFSESSFRATNPEILNEIKNSNILYAKIHDEDSAIVTVMTDYGEYNIPLVKEYGTWKINLGSMLFN